MPGYPASSPRSRSSSARAGGGGLLVDPARGEVAGIAEQPELGQPVEPRALTVDSLAAGALVGLPQQRLEPRRRRVGRGPGEVADRVVATQVEAAEGALVEV